MGIIKLYHEKKNCVYLIEISLIFVYSVIIGNFKGFVVSGAKYNVGIKSCKMRKKALALMCESSKENTKSKVVNYLELMTKGFVGLSFLFIIAILTTIIYRYTGPANLPFFDTLYVSVIMTLIYFCLKKIMFSLTLSNELSESNLSYSSLTTSKAMFDYWIGKLDNYSKKQKSIGIYIRVVLSLFLFFSTHYAMLYITGSDIYINRFLAEKSNSLSDMLLVSSSIYLGLFAALVVIPYAIKGNIHLGCYVEIYEKARDKDLL